MALRSSTPLIRAPKRRRPNAFPSAVPASIRSNTRSSRSSLSLIRERDQAPAMGACRAPREEHGRPTPHLQCARRQSATPPRQPRPACREPRRRTHASRGVLSEQVRARRGVPLDVAPMDRKATSRPCSSTRRSASSTSSGGVSSVTSASNQDPSKATVGGLPTGLPCWADERIVQLLGTRHPASSLANRA